MIATRTIHGNNSGPYLRRPKVVVMHATRSGRAGFTLKIPGFYRTEPAVAEAERVVRSRR